jgi:hypothetical protein
VLIEICLLLLGIGLAAYDFRVQRVPNWVTLPLLITGMLLNFPGDPLTWLGCLLLFSAWYHDALGGGDAKLWMAYLWLVPLDLAQAAVLMMGISLLSTAALQLLLRRLCQLPVFQVRGPGAWRVVPFAVWLTIAGIGF